MPTIKTFKKENKQANINLVDEILEVEFIENGRVLGAIEYPNKSYHYVEDAAENWCAGVLTKETLDQYKRAA